VWPHTILCQIVWSCKFFPVSFCPTIFLYWIPMCLNTANAYTQYMFRIQFLFWEALELESIAKYGDGQQMWKREQFLVAVKFCQKLKMWRETQNLFEWKMAIFAWMTLTNQSRKKFLGWIWRAPGRCHVCIGLFLVIFGLRVQEIHLVCNFVLSLENGHKAQS